MHACKLPAQASNWARESTGRSEDETVDQHNRRGAAKKRPTHQVEIPNQQPSFVAPFLSRVVCQLEHLVHPRFHFRSPQFPARRSPIPPRIVLPPLLGRLVPIRNSKFGQLHQHIDDASDTPVPPFLLVPPFPSVDVLNSVPDETDHRAAKSTERSFEEIQVRSVGRGGEERERGEGGRGGGEGRRGLGSDRLEERTGFLEHRTRCYLRAHILEINDQRSAPLFSCNGLRSRMTTPSH